VYGLIKQTSATLLQTTLLLAATITASAASAPDFEQRLDAFLSQLNQPLNFPEPPSNTVTLASAKLHYQGCQNYPYHNANSTAISQNTLTNDIKRGLKQGLSCLAGNSPMGKLHPYHETQAIRLMRLLESDQPKTVRCVADEIFAYAVANSPVTPGRKPHPQDKMTEGLPYPGILIDTFRLSGSISKKLDEATYREFYQLDSGQLAVIRKGKPLQLAGMHRYQNRAALMFHEMIHWLGHEHSSIYPDTTDLYETCCFGGSDFISDDTANKAFQQQACAILKDDELWSANKYRQMRLWKHKGYDQLKRAMRDFND
jgi:hypothetical protein